jgi:CubicO group peptidase (beta-lactamase class C family)
MRSSRFASSAGIAALAAILVGATPGPIGLPQTPTARERDWGPVTSALEGFLEQERTDKQLPAISIALVDGDRIVWSRGFGLADPVAKTPADGHTLYRMGSLTKLFSDVAIMQLVEKGTLDLDAHVSRYLPEFRPKNPFGKPITVRDLITHRAGLVREPPVGNHADSNVPPLAAVVQSVGRTELVYAPESRAKFSEAGIAVEAYLLEKMRGQPFAACVTETVLQPIGMTRSGFDGSSPARAIAKGFLWTYDGRTFDAPAFPVGVASGTNLDASVDDLARFLSVLVAGGRL